MRRGLIIGILGWLAATIVFRLLGHLILVPGPGLFATFLIGGVAAAIVALLLVRVFCEAGKVARFAGGVVAPGLFGDATATLMFEDVFPATDPTMSTVFAAMMLWGYGIILSTILLFGDRLVPSAGLK
ncbi:MAG: DUF5367 family protein [Hyphomicrobiales bacterium]|nr:DUF5367 family protein [Hyphomicrobiales bacterium]